MGGSWSSKSSGMAARPVELAATARHTATVIFLHGLGDTGHGWSSAFEQIRRPHIKYICPTAPVSPVTLNAGFKMPSWFDIYGLSPSADEDEAGIKKSSEILQQLIAEEEKQGIPRNRIVVGGFSQGGAVALFSSLSAQKPSVAGIVALSTWMPLHKKYSQESKSNTETPIFQCHGESDPVVPFQWGDLTAKLLKSFNKNHSWKTYRGMMHSSCDQEMEDVKGFIDTVLPVVE